MARLVHLLSLLPLLNCCLVLTSAYQCLIRTHEEIEAPFSVNVLNYINPWNGTEIAIAYDNLDDVNWRDSFLVSNFQTKQYTTRNGKSEEQHFPHVIVVPHGWNTMNLTVFGNQFNLTLNDTQPVTIISSDLISEIASVTLYGKFSICQSLSPTWKVGEGKSVEVPLQPQYTWGSSQRQQTLLVTGPTNARPYLTSPSHPDDKTYIPPNINFLVNTSYQQSSVFMYPYQDGVYDAEGVRQHTITSKLTLIVGSDQGDFLLRLALSPPPLARLSPPPLTVFDSLYWILGLLSFLVGVGIGVLIHIMWLNMSHKVFTTSQRRRHKSPAPHSPEYEYEPETRATKRISWNEPYTPVIHLQMPLLNPPTLVKSTPKTFIRSSSPDNSEKSIPRQQ